MVASDGKCQQETKPAFHFQPSQFATCQLLHGAFVEVQWAGHSLAASKGPEHLKALKALTA